MSRPQSNHSVQIIAEIGSVHDGSLGNAHRLIAAAAQCGANAAKFQTHIASAETLRNAPAPPYFKGEPRYEYFLRTAFTKDEWCALKMHCEESGVAFLSSPFSIEAVDLLEDVGVEAYKIGSGEISNTPLLEQVASTGKPIILSSGMSTWRELDEAVEIVLKAHRRLTILQCTSEYPCPYEEVGLNIMLEMRERYDLPVGLSDHTLTNYAAFAAVTAGAAVIEKHFTFSRLMYGSDAPHSLEPTEFAELVTGIRAIELMNRHPVDKNANAKRLQHMKDIFEKSVVTLVDIPAGAVVTETMIGLKKPGTGIPARRIADVIGKRTRRALQKDALIRPDELEGWVDADA